MKFTFLLPAYKPQFLSETTKSILLQTYTEFELIILDDCSPYNLNNIIKQYNDNRIKYFRNEKNLGGTNLTQCWDKLLSFTDAQYIILASDDDIYKPNFLEEANKLITKYPNIDLIRGKVDIINEKDDIINSEDSIEDEILDFNKFIEFMYIKNSIKCIPNYIFKRTALEKINGFIEFPLAWYSDTATAMLLAYNSVGMINDTVFLFRHSGINISSTVINSQMANKKSIATLKYNLWFKKNILPLYTGTERKKIKRKHNLEIIQMLNWHLFHCKKGDFLKLFFKMIKNRINPSSTIFKAFVLAVSSFKQKF